MPQRSSRHSCRKGAARVGGMLMLSRMASITENELILILAPKAGAGETGHRFHAFVAVARKRGSREAPTPASRESEPLYWPARIRG